MQQVQAMDGFTISVGQAVEFWGEGTHGEGTVREIKGDRVFIDINEATAEVDSGRWKLNAKAAEWSGRADFWQARDHGVSLGCIKRPHWGWAPLSSAA